MTLTQLEYVLAIDKFRHFGKAATACYVTQPTLSMQLQKLEGSLGAIIFDRSKKPIIPTIEGEAIIRQIKLVLKEYNKIFEICKIEKNQLTGDFKLGVIPTLSPYILPLFVPSFTGAYPGVNLAIEEYNTQDIIQHLENDELDGAILVTPLNHDLMIERVIFYEPFYLFAGESHPILKKKVVSRSDIDPTKVWLHSKETSVPIQAFAENFPRMEGIKFESGSIETLKNLVLSGYGYTLLPHLAVRLLPDKYKKLVREFSGPIPTREVSLVHARIFQKERIIEALESEIVKAIPFELKCLKRRHLTPSAAV